MEWDNFSFCGFLLEESFFSFSSVVTHVMYSTKHVKCRLDAIRDLFNVQ